MHRNRRALRPTATRQPMNFANYFGLGVPNGGMRNFSASLRAYSVAMMPGNDKQNVENGGKIILPPSCLEILTQLNTVYPMLFKLTNEPLGRSSHCGVLEFIADEGLCYLPYWMMQNLLLGEGSPIQIESVTLPVASFSKFQPQSTDFLDISNPKAMLENALRHFACLTTGDTIAIRYNDKIYDLKVLETKPGAAVSIIECDMDVDFAPPVGYVEPVVQPKAEAPETSCNYAAVLEDVATGSFSGAGQRLDGKQASSSDEVRSTVTRARGVPDYDYQPFSLSFVRDLSYFAQRERSGNAPTFEAFTGQGEVLRANRG